ncbi:MAG: hypothetical protein EBQ92_00160 [Proteobacteria bacterium]|nr:hypothetical protein [Pseudomonadota bacterium]
MEPEFVGYWRRLRQVVQQRNALLKQPRSDAQLLGWTALLVQLSMHIQQLRLQYITGFVQYLNVLLGEDAKCFQVQLEQGWPADQALDTCLDRGLEQDKRMGFTRFGAHRADLKLLYNGQLAKQVLSRGQKKLFNARLMMAQLKHLFRDHARQSISLLDDLSAELDEENRYKIYQSLNDLQSQVFITGVQLDPVLVSNEFSLKMFHVERGALIESSGCEMNI